MRYDGDKHYKTIYNVGMGNIGGTSYEVEIVVAIIAGLIMTIIFYINIRQLINRTYDIKRLNDAITISQAISLYTVEEGHLPLEITISEKEISNIDGKCASVCNKGLTCVNLLASILPHLEIKNLSSVDGYSVQLGRGGMVTVRSCVSRTGEIIEVTR